VRPSFGEKPAPADADTGTDIADVPLSQASLPSDSLLASADAQQIQPESNDRVQKWIDFFTGRGRKTFSAWLQRSGSYMDMMVPVLERNGMPADLIHLVFVESGFNPKAFSSSAASGPWQFVRGTAQIFGLNVDAKFDERRDPARSTEAAAQYLKHLYSLFHDWPLALAAYNSGEGTVLRALKSQNTFDYWSLHLPRQTEDYVPEFMAALTIARDPAAFGFEGKLNPPLSFDQIVVPGGLNLRVLSYLTAAPLEELKNLNPAILRRQAPRTGGGVLVRVPRGTGAECINRLQAKDYPASLAAPEREPRRASAHAARHGRHGHGSKATAAHHRAHSSSTPGKHSAHGAKSTHAKSAHSKSASSHSTGHHKKSKAPAHKSRVHHQ
jgi:membrane-bound lytic murein transglycosylase D